MISIQNLTKRYGEIVAVNGISLEVARGEILGFLGPNGAGKSTTLKSITCFIRIDGGRITVGGIDVTKDSLAARRKIGYLPEANPLYTDMRVAEFLAYVAELRSIPGPERKRRIGKVVEVCGLGEVLMKGIGELSKGFRQRVGLAQAMVHEPEILLLDEPTSGLDPNQIIEIRELIKEIGKEKTVVLSTHILPEVSATCSRVAIIHRGRIVADGTPTELQQASKDWLAIRVRVKGDVVGIEDDLGSLPEVDRVKTLSLDGGKEALFEIRPAQGKDITEDIFRFAVERGVTLKELRIVGATLEDVFHQLTQQGEAMATTYAITKKEFLSYINSPIAYVFVIIFLGINGVLFLFLNNFFLAGEADMRGYFGFLPFVYLFFIPAMTMRLWAEEKKLGTFELLLTLPVRSWEAVAGKFLASWGLVMIALLLSLPIPLFISWFLVREASAGLDWGAVTGSYIGSAFLAGAFLSLGLFFSSLTENQIVAFILAVSFSFAAILIGMPVMIEALQWLPGIAGLEPALEYAGMHGHFESVARGVIDSRDVIYYGSFTFFFLMVTSMIVENRRK